MSAIPDKLPVRRSNKDIFSRYLLIQLKTSHIMSNGSSNDLAGAISGLVDTVAKLGQQQIEVLNNGLKTVSDMVGPLGKTMTDMMGNMANTLNQVLQNVSSNIGGSK